MTLKLPKETERFSWTAHAAEKMKFYGLSEQKVRGVISRPYRTETGLAPQTTAVMQRTASKKHPTEIWVMYQLARRASTKSQITNHKQITNPKLQILNQEQKKFKIISAWRYPGISRPREVPMPEDVEREVIK